MAKWVIVGLLVLLITQQVSADQPPPPVEVHVRADNALYMYDCYPVNMEGPVEQGMIVYINYPEGVAGYLCNYGGGAWIIPFVPPAPVQIANVGVER